jgi:hypothetical protein
MIERLERRVDALERAWVRYHPGTVGDGTSLST